uniref:Uncharacterized protein n=1 Tax=Brassica campestris TaxID=3711 RepID=M4FA27_BRACM
MPDFEHRLTDFNQNRSTASPEHRSTTPTELTASYNAVKIMTHEEFVARHPHPTSPVYVNIDRQTDPAIDRQHETASDRQPPAPIDRPNPPKTTSTHSEDEAEPMEVDKAPMGKTLRKRKEKVAKDLKRGANEKEMKTFLKRVFKIPLEIPFEDAYFTHRLWMFFKETKEAEEDTRRMFYETREKMKNMITLKKKSDPGKFAIPCLKVEPSKESFTFVDCYQQSSGGIIRDLEVQTGNALVPVDFHVLDIKLNWNSSMLLGRAFLSTRHATVELSTRQSIPRRSKLTPPTLINNTNQKSIDNHIDESIDSSPDNWENDYYNPTLAEHSARPSTRATLHKEEYDEDYEEERTTEYRGICDEEGNYSIGSWADDRYHESYAVETSVHEIRAKNFFMQQRNIPEHQQRVANEFYNTFGEVDDHFKPKYRQHTRPSIDIGDPTSIDRRPEFGKRAYDRDGTRRFHWEEN